MCLGGKPFPAPPMEIENQSMINLVTRLCRMMCQAIANVEDESEQCKKCAKKENFRNVMMRATLVVVVIISIQFKAKLFSEIQ